MFEEKLKIRVNKCENDWNKSLIDNNRNVNGSKLKIIYFIPVEHWEEDLKQDLFIKATIQNIQTKFELKGDRIRKYER